MPRQSGDNALLQLKRPRSRPSVYEPTLLVCRRQGHLPSCGSTTSTWSWTEPDCPHRVSCAHLGLSVVAWRRAEGVTSRRAARDAGVQGSRVGVQGSRAVEQGCRGTGQWSRSTGEQDSGAGVQGSRGVGVQESRGTGQGCMGAGVQGCVPRGSRILDRSRRDPPNRWGPDDTILQGQQEA